MGKLTGKTCRLLTMLALTVSFFFVEIVVGYVTNSMALVADSFHMLSDVLALLIGFFAVRISRRKSKKNTFGWARAEVLGALVNAVFLVALCFSILIEALKRIIVVEKITNVDMMFIVGSLGLVINLIGLVLFHDHGHGHGSGGGGSHAGSIVSTSPYATAGATPAQRSSTILSTPAAMRVTGGSLHHLATRLSGGGCSDRPGAFSIPADEDRAAILLAASRERLGSFDKLNMSGTKYIEAATARDDDDDEDDVNERGGYADLVDEDDIIVDQNRPATIYDGYQNAPTTGNKPTTANGGLPAGTILGSPDLTGKNPSDAQQRQPPPPYTASKDGSNTERDIESGGLTANRYRSSSDARSRLTGPPPDAGTGVRFATGRSSTPQSAGHRHHPPHGKGATLSSHHLNMRGVFLHVLGDALGSVIVIISALSIKYFHGDWKYYIDPCMSLLLVIIILCTTAPLLKESALILLQTVPPHIRIDELRDRLIHDIDGVLAVHEFHVWQLAGTKIIATAHIRCRNILDYMKIASRIKEFFHREGIHSTTIQPEFVEAIDEEEKCLLLCQGTLDCAPKTCCGKRPLLPNGSALGPENAPQNGASSVAYVNGIEGIEIDSLHNNINNGSGTTAHIPRPTAPNALPPPKSALPPPPGAPNKRNPGPHENNNNNSNILKTNSQDINSLDPYPLNLTVKPKLNAAKENQTPINTISGSTSTTADKL